MTPEPQRSTEEFQAKQQVEAIVLAISDAKTVETATKFDRLVNELKNEEN